MKILLRFALTITVVFSTLRAWEEVTSNVDDMFSNGTLSGEYRAVFAGYKQKVPDVNGTQSGAVGGYLKYELSELNGFNAGIAYMISYDMNTSSFAEGYEQNDELSSADGKYGVMNEAYLNYKNGGFNLRAGRQIIDTPLADSDDIRMIKNTFESYIATYEDDKFSLMLGNLQRWQGVDAGLLDEWALTGENGTWFGGISYSGDIVHASAWRYNVTQLTNASYLELSFNHEINSDVSMVWAFQSLKESELTKSGIQASIFGTLVEFKAYGFGLNMAYNESDGKKDKGSFSGFGGGTLFTSMDTMILDEITYDRNATAMVGGLSYENGDFVISYSYGKFYGDADGAGDKAYIVERNVGLEYSFIKDELKISIAYTVEEDVESVVINENDWVRGQVMLTYNF